jgi:hypothetical protein
LKRLLLDCLTLASLAALAALPFYLTGRESFRPVIEMIATALDAAGVPYPFP